MRTERNGMSIRCNSKSGSEKSADALLDFSARSPKAAPTDLGQPSCLGAAGAWRRIKAETQWRGRHTADEQPRPCGVVRQVEQRVGAAEANLLGDNCGVGCTGAAGQHRADIAEHSGP